MLKEFLRHRTGRDALGEFLCERVRLRLDKESRLRAGAKLDILPPSAMPMYRSSGLIFYLNESGDCITKQNEENVYVPILKVSTECLRPINEEPDAKIEKLFGELYRGMLEKENALRDKLPEGDLGYSVIIPVRTGLKVTFVRNEEQEGYEMEEHIGAACHTGDTPRAKVTVE